MNYQLELEKTLENIFENVQNIVIKICKKDKKSYFT